MSIPLVEPMAASVAASLPIGPQWSYEVKWDGYRALLLKDGTRTKLVSRNLKDLTADYPHIVAAAKSLPGSVLLDGEIVALGEHGLPTFQALQHRSIKRTAVRKTGNSAARNTQRNDFALGGGSRTPMAV